MIRWLRRLYLQGLVRELELAIEFERRRHDNFEAAIRCWNWEITRLKQKVERLGGKRQPRLQPWLSGLRRRS